MAVSRRFGLGAGIFAIAFVVAAACGDSEGDKEKDEKAALQVVSESVRAFANGHRQSDDITLVAVRRQ